MLSLQYASPNASKVGKAPAIGSRSFGLRQQAVSRFQVGPPSNRAMAIRARRTEGVAASGVNLKPRGLGCRSRIWDGSLPHFDLSIACADFEAGLWVHGWSVHDVAIFQVKLGSVIRTHNAVIH